MEIRQEGTFSLLQGKQGSCTTFGCKSGVPSHDLPKDQVWRTHFPDQKFNGSTLHPINFQTPQSSRSDLTFFPISLPSLHLQNEQVLLFLNEVPPSATFRLCSSPYWPTSAGDHPIVLREQLETEIKLKRIDCKERKISHENQKHQVQLYLENWKQQLKAIDSYTLFLPFSPPPSSSINQICSISPSSYESLCCFQALLPLPFHIH